MRISTGKLATDPDRHDLSAGRVPQERRSRCGRSFRRRRRPATTRSPSPSRCNVELDLKTRHAPRFRPPDGSTPEDYPRPACATKGAKKRYGEITDRDQGADRPRAGGDPVQGLLQLLPDRLGLLQLRPRERNIPAGGQGQRRRHDRRLLPGPVRRGPAPVRPAVRAVHGPGAKRDARYRHRHLPGPPARRSSTTSARSTAHVAQIITFGTMKAKAVIRDVCRVLGVPLAEADRLAKLVPAALDMTLDKALETEPELKQAYDTNELTRKVIDIGRKLEGPGPSRLGARRRRGHRRRAADELRAALQSARAPTTSSPSTKARWSRRCGLLKMDFLGLKTLSVLERARQLVKRTHGDGHRPGEARPHGPEGLRGLRDGQDQGRVPVRIRRHAGPADEDEAGPHRGPDRRQRPVPPRPDGPDPRLHRPQARRELEPARTRS